MNSEENVFAGELDRFCITDVGSTTTKAILFEKDERWSFYREEAPTTVEKPHEDVSIGVLQAFKALENTSGRTLLKNGAPAIPYLATSSAGGGLAMVVTGLVKEITAQSADRVALGAGAIVLDVVAMNDGRTPYRKIEDLKRARPDMVLLAGGFDGDAITGPVFLAELIVESGLHPKLNPDAKLPIIYAGNVRAQGYVRKALSNRFLFYPVDNIRPSGDVEQLEPARHAINMLFMEHVMSQAPGYERVKRWVSAPIRPTPSAFGTILGLLSKELRARILAIDIGGATTDVFSAEGGDVFRTVSANLGMSYSILNLVEVGGMTAIRELSGSRLTETEIYNRIGNKHLHPTRLPATADDLEVEWAAATIAIREAVRAHLQVMSGASIALSRADMDLNTFLLEEPTDRIERKTFSLEDYDYIIGSGGILSHSQRTAAAMMLIDSLQPGGHVELAVDRAFMFPHLGVLAEVNPALARELLFDLALVPLGTLYAPIREADKGQFVELTGRTNRDNEVDETVERDEVVHLGLEVGETIEATYHPGDSDLQMAVLQGGVCGAVVDMRPRPFAFRTETLLAEPIVPPKEGKAPFRIAPLQVGEITLRRELAIPGEVFVKVGDRVQPGTPVARSVRQFLRPFFLRVAETMEVSAEELPNLMVKEVGEEISRHEIIAKKKRPHRFTKVFRSPVEGRLEKVLSSGVVVVREHPERAREVTVVEVSKEMGVSPKHLIPYLRCEVGQEVETGQWLAGNLSAGNRICKAPVRGRVSKIDLDRGWIYLEPLLEELEVHAWLPGEVIEVTDRGCVVANRGAIITGVWGQGGEIHGDLCFDKFEEGQIAVRHHTTPDFLSALRSKGARGLITGSLDLRDVLAPVPDFTLVVTEGFGRREIAPEVYESLKAREGKLALIDGTTQLRVGVVRPRIFLPEA